MTEITSFEPALYSLAELAFLKAHLEEPPVVALSNSMPKGVNPIAVRNFLTTIYELNQLKEHKGKEWCGYQAIRDSIDLFIESYERDLELHRAGAPRFPSLEQWDARGRPHAYGAGSDSGIVRTRINDDGTRTKFAVNLIGNFNETFIAPWTKKSSDVTLLHADLDEDTEKGFVQCPLCGKAENYKPESQSSRNAAREKIRKHMLSMVGPSADSHRELAVHIFG